MVVFSLAGVAALVGASVTGSLMVRAEPNLRGH
jgi:hypothetical protein